MYCFVLHLLDLARNSLSPLQGLSNGSGSPLAIGLAISGQQSPPFRLRGAEGAIRGLAKRALVREAPVPSDPAPAGILAARAGTLIRSTVATNPSPLPDPARSRRILQDAGGKNHSCMGVQPSQSMGGRFPRGGQRHALPATGSLRAGSYFQNAASCKRFTRSRKCGSILTSVGAERSPEEEGTMSTFKSPLSQRARTTAHRGLAARSGDQPRTLTEDPALAVAAVSRAALRILKRYF